MLTKTAAPDASTPAEPFTAHSQGVVRESMRAHSRMRAGNMKPMSMPAGTTVRRQIAARSTSDPVSE